MATVRAQAKLRAWVRLRLGVGWRPVRCYDGARWTGRGRPDQRTLCATTVSGPDVVPARSRRGVGAKCAGLARGACVRVCAWWPVCIFSAFCGARMRTALRSRPCKRFSDSDLCRIWGAGNTRFLHVVSTNVVARAGLRKARLLAQCNGCLKLAHPAREVARSTSQHDGTGSIPPPWNARQSATCQGSTCLRVRNGSCPSPYFQADHE